MGIDIREAHGQGAGKGRYAEEITKALIRQAPDLQFFLFTKVPNPRFENSERVKQVVIGGKGPLWHLNLRRYLKHHPVDFFLAPTSFIYPAIAPREQKLAVVVHDLIAFLHSKDHHWFPTLVERLTLKRALKRAEWVVTVSDNTWKDLKQVYPWAAEKAQLTLPPGLSAEMHKVSERHLNLPEPYLLAVGTLSPRKNVQGVIQAFEKLAPDSPSLNLCIAGGEGWKHSELMKRIPPALQSRIHFLGYVSNPDLVELYSRAHVLVFPSFYEGFGIPALEAMACECPVVTSSVSSLPEVVEEAGWTVDPADTEALVAAIKESFIPMRREEAIQKGKVQASLFSWDRSAAELLSHLQ